MLAFVGKTDVKREHIVQRQFLCLVAPAFVRREQFAELRSPVAEMIYAHGIPAEVFIYAVERAAYRRAHQVAYVERFGYVYGRVVYTHRLSGIFSRARLRVFTRHDAAHERRTRQVEIEVSARYFRALYDVAVRERRGKFRRYRLRTFAELLCVLKARQRIVAVPLRRYHDVVRRHERTTQKFAYLFLIVHTGILTQ